MSTTFKIQQNTNYSFVFGNVGVGKSTLVATLAKFFSLNTVIHTNPNNSDGNTFLFNWLSNLNKKKFPPRSNVGDIYEIDLGIEFIKGNNDLLKITFLEMSGEDLVIVDKRLNKNEFGEKFIKYTEASKMFIVVTDPEHAEDDDFLIWQFFSHLTSMGADMSAIALVVAKWDIVNDNQSLKEFVSNKMPQTTNWLFSDNIDNAQVFSFSVGNVNANSIEDLNLNDCEKIGEWIYNTLT